jgi:peptidyl-prolyl cis-trans isomerase C
MRPSVLFVSAVLFLVGCDGASGTGGGASKGAATQTAVIDIGRELGSANGVPVGDIEFKQAAARKAPADGKALSLAERKEVLDRLIEEKLLYKAALAKGFDKDPKVQKVMVNTLLREELYKQVKNSDYTDAELQAYYEAHKDEFEVPEKVQLKRILIKVSEKRSEADAQTEAKRIYDLVKGSPDKFKELAGQHSEDAYRRRGGDVGFVAKSGKPGLDQEVVDKAFTLNEGQISEPFRSPEGFNIVQVAAKRERVVRTFAQMKGSVLRKVKNEKLKELYDSYVAQLRQGADIKMDEKALMEVDLSAPAPGALMKGGEEGGPGMDGPSLEGPGDEEEAVPAGGKEEPPAPKEEGGQ